jgi:hypothetical protein
MRPRQFSIASSVKVTADLVPVTCLLTETLRNTLDKYNCVSPLYDIGLKSELLVEESVQRIWLGCALVSRHQYSGGFMPRQMKNSRRLVADRH